MLTGSDIKRNKLSVNGAKNLLRFKVHGVYVASNWQVRVESTRSLLSITRTNYSIQSRLINIGDLRVNYR